MQAELSRKRRRISHVRHKLIAFLLGFANLLVAAAPAVGIQVLLRGRLPDLVGLAAGTAVLFILYIAGSRWIERRKPVELAPGGRQILQGFVLGFLLFACVMGILAACGAYRVSGATNWRTLAFGLPLALLAAIFEELLFRGFLFRIFAILGGNWVGLAVTAGLFGLAHKANPNATLFSSVAIAIEAGILLGAAYAASGSLWLPIGIHAGWNFTEGSVFGTAVSGTHQTTGVLTGNLHGPTILTGGAFGPEASIVAIAVCLVPAIYYLYRMPNLPRSSSNRQSIS